MKGIPRELLEKYIRGSCTPQEVEELLDVFTHREIDFEQLSDFRESLPGYSESENPKLDERLGEVLILLKNQIGKGARLRKRQFVYWSAVAASLLLALGIYVHVLFSRVDTNKTDYGQTGPTSFDSPTLLFGDGHTLTLDKLDSVSRLSAHPSQHVIKDQNGFIRLAGDESTEDQIRFHTLRTPKQAVVQFILPDGSKVWLNANSELIFPSKFSNEERRVKLVGEAYFDIQKDKGRFVIETTQQDLTVLGTQFNLSSYPADPTDITTLVEGRVSIIMKSNPIELVLNSEGDQLSVGKTEYNRSKVNVESYVGWKGGWFIFHNMTVREMCTQISRWYGLNLDCRINNARRYYGEIKRDVPLSEVLELIENIAGVRIRQTGTDLTVF